VLPLESDFDACMGPKPATSVRAKRLTPEENRMAIAQSLQKGDAELLPDRHRQYAATGIQKRTLTISMPSVS
jgi:hypothetical protein